MSIAEILCKNERVALNMFREKCTPLCLSTGAEKKLISMFKSAFSKSYETDIKWDCVKPLTKNELFPYDSLDFPKDPREILKQLVVVKLNGGLGTTMGCTFPKGLIKVTDDKSFFDLTMDQIKSVNKKYNVDIPLILMHSFYTEESMKKVINDAKGINILTFNQNKFPKIDAETLEPVPKDKNAPLVEWNPPGHGDVYHCLRDSGILDKLLNEGKKYMFISNIDNLGATINLKILNKVVTENRSYAAETVARTQNDWKGGIPIDYKGHIKLLETAQVPNGHIEDFKNVKTFSIFNSNNLWVNLSKLKKALDEDTLILDVIKNRKQYNGREIIQLEAAAGSAIQSFDDSISVKVPRKRFIPVKSCNELLMLRSDLYQHSSDGIFKLNKNRRITSYPSVNLSKKFQNVCDFENRIKAVPSLLNVGSFEVQGDVTFGEGVVIEGNVLIRGPNDKTALIKNEKLKDCEKVLLE